MAVHVAEGIEVGDTATGEVVGRVMAEGVEVVDTATGAVVGRLVADGFEVGDTATGEVVDRVSPQAPAITPIIATSPKKHARFIGDSPHRDPPY